MKTAFPRSPFRLPVMAGFCLALGLTGCVTQRLDWRARVGHYTYAQALTDMGAPEKQDKLSDGALVAEWLIKRGYTYTEGSPGPYGPFYPTNPRTDTAPSRFLRLTFGPDGQLTTWKEFHK
jgi:hypothetical protein